MEKQNNLIQLIRISSGLALSSFFLFLLRELDLIPINNEYLFTIDWIGILSFLIFAPIYFIGVVNLEKEQIKKVNITDKYIYLYGLVFFVCIYLILIIYFG